jgi:hypothetical protein
MASALKNQFSRVRLIKERIFLIYQNLNTFKALSFLL